MTALIGHPALRLLARRKLKGVLRKQARRLKSWKGILLSVLGVSLFLIWMGGLLLHAFIGSPIELDVEGLESLVGVGAFALTVLSLSGALVHRGLYMPSEEIERIFSGPIPRADVVRYRLLVNVGRGTLGAVIVGLFTANRMPRPLFAFLGVFLLVQTLPVLHQAAAILSGLVENRLARRFRWLRTLIFGAMLFAIIIGVPLVVFFGGRGVDSDAPMLVAWLQRLGNLGLDGWQSHPLVHAITWPFQPWTRMILADRLATFAPWCLVSIGLWIALAEATARLPVDYRELSLETSASVAARLRRARRGGGAATVRVSKATRGLRVPWLFGRGPAGAIAWRKLVSIVRKAKGTFAVSGLVLALVTILSLAFLGGDELALAGPLLVAFLGTLYLCAGLRFDFRDELERMEIIKAWPLAPTRLFAAMILPEALLVSLLLIAAVLVRALLAEEMSAAVGVIAAFLPLGVVGWIALDNAAFLFLPVRFVPGQEGALQNAGRGVLMMFVRLLALAFMLAFCFLPPYLIYTFGGAALGIEGDGLLVVSGFLLWILLVLFDLGVIWVGGWMLARFDVARDRG